MKLLDGIPDLPVEDTEVSDHNNIVIGVSPFFITILLNQPFYNKSL